MKGLNLKADGHEYCGWVEKDEDDKFYWKYNEDLILRDALDYIATTYKGHYVQNENNNGVQVNDLLLSIGHAKSGFICNAIEYLSRYGKKDGKNVKDLYKAIHNIVLLIDADSKNSECKTKPTISPGIDIIERD